MRKWLLLACIFTIDATAAQPSHPTETVTVNASPLVGVWKLDWPQWGRIPGNKWGPLGDRYCRIEQRKGDLAIRCLSRGNGAGNIGIGTVSLEGDRVRLAWGSIVARIALDGTLQSPGAGPTLITGKVSARIAGFYRENPASSRATRLSLSDDADTGGKTMLLRTALRQLALGSLTLPHDKEAIENNGGALPMDIQALGALQAAIYLGPSFQELSHSTNGLPDMDLESFSVYAVEFDGGQRICALHQRPDAVLDVFHCV
jgi:hypothetical protein